MRTKKAGEGERPTKSSGTIDRDFARAFADDWSRDWNAGDIERILSHYADDIEVWSPLIVARGFSAEGSIRGKSLLRAYWSVGLSLDPPLRFEVKDVFVGVNSITILYRSVGRKLVCETFFFDRQRRVVRAVVNYGAE